jgi:ABC-2 type transport system permease protein
VLFALLFVLLFIVFNANNLSHEVETAPRDEYWIGELENENINIDIHISENPDLDDDVIKDLLDKKAVNLYRIEHDLQPNKDKSIVGLLQYNNIVYMLVIILTLVVSTRIITDEFKNDSIKLIATTPYTRREILFTKLLVVVMTPVLFILVILIFSILIGGYYFSFSNLNSMRVDVINNAITVESNYVYMIKQWMLQSYSLISISTLAILLGIIFKNALVSILTSILIYLFGTYLTVFLVEFDWIKYTLFPHLNYYIYTYDNIKLPEFSSSFSYIIISIYLIIFLLSAFFVFDRKEL